MEPDPKDKDPRPGVGWAIATEATRKPGADAGADADAAPDGAGDEAAVVDVAAGDACVAGGAAVVASRIPTTASL